MGFSVMAHPDGDNPDDEFYNPANFMHFAMDPACSIAIEKFSNRFDQLQSFTLHEIDFSTFYNHQFVFFDELENRLKNLTHFAMENCRNGEKVLPALFAQPLPNLKSLAFRHDETVNACKIIEHVPELLKNLELLIFDSISGVCAPLSCFVAKIHLAIHYSNQKFNDDHGGLLEIRIKGHDNQRAALLAEDRKELTKFCCTDVKISATEVFVKVCRICSKHELRA